MSQVDLIIVIVVMINSLSFFVFGYFVGSKERKTIIIETEKGKYEFKDKPVEEKAFSGGLANYPKNGIRSTFIDEPSGPVYRPTAAELRKMNEDEVTKANKEAVAKTFKEEEVPAL